MILWIIWVVLMRSIERCLHACKEDVSLILKLHKHYYDQGKTTVFEGSFRDEALMPGTRATRWQDFCAMHGRVGTLAQMFFKVTSGFNRKNKTQGMLVVLRCDYERYSNVFHDKEIFGDIANYKYMLPAAGEEEANEIADEAASRKVPSDMGTP